MSMLMGGKIREGEESNQDGTGGGVQGQERATAADTGCNRFYKFFFLPSINFVFNTNTKKRNRIRFYRFFVVPYQSQDYFLSGNTIGWPRS